MVRDARELHLQSGTTLFSHAPRVPGRYVLGDHALSRLERGLADFLIAEWPENHGVFKADKVSDAGH